VSGDRGQRKDMDRNTRETRLRKNGYTAGLIAGGGTECSDGVGEDAKVERKIQGPRELRGSLGA
jgi:hypothetical protein